MCNPDPPPLVCIASNPDVAGIGVRTAIYAQNFLSFVPAIYALSDKRVTKVELESLETQATGILITAFAILLSVTIQPRTGAPVSNFHTAIILNLSWMNNTNAFIYFILRVYHELENCLGSLNRADNKILSSQRMSKGIIRSWLQVIKGAAWNRAGLFGSLHLSLMAAIGIWLWHNPADFQGSPCCAMQASLYVVGGRVPFTSMGLRVWSMMMYSLMLIPGFNLVLPATLFLAMYVAVWRFCTSSHILDTYIIAVRTGLALLFMVNVILLVDTEIMLAKNSSPFLEGDQTQWTFGQTLALPVLMVPLRDIYDTMRHRRADELGEEVLKLLGGKEEINDDAVIRLLNQGANVATLTSMRFVN
jgi:hypothetical protein